MVVPNTKRRGQSLTEMAFVAPLLLVLVFAIIDFSFIIFSYATLSQAVRNGAEVASGAPPLPVAVVNGDAHARGAIDTDDRCVAAIVEATMDHATDLHTDMEGSISIIYPPYQNDIDGTPLVRSQRRRIGYPIEVAIIDYEIRPITPLFDLIPLIGEEGSGGERVFRVTAVARRSIESYGRDPTNERLSACDPEVGGP